MLSMRKYYYNLWEGGFALYAKFETLLCKRGITSYQVAKATGISQVTLSQWKSGRSTPKVDKLLKIATYLNVSIEDLIETESEKIKGISFYKLSKELEFNDSFFSEWKRGKMMPKHDKIQKIANYFGVSTECIEYQ